MVSGTELLDRLAEARLLGIVRGADAAAVEATAHVLIDAGVELLEVSLTSPDALAVINRLAGSAAQRAVIGAGTVLSTAQAEAVHAAGARFAVTPDLGAGARRAVALGLPTVAGVLTPTEVRAATELGAAAVKLFPAASMGPGYLRALRGPYPDVHVVPVGGVDVGNAAEYLACGAVAVGASSALVADAADGGDLDALVDRAHAFLAAVAA